MRIEMDFIEFVEDYCQQYILVLSSFDKSSLAPVLFTSLYLRDNGGTLGVAGNVSSGAIAFVDFKCVKLHQLTTHSMWISIANSDIAADALQSLMHVTPRCTIANTNQRIAVEVQCD